MANVMIVDDSGAMRKIITRSLLQTGLSTGEIYEAANGLEGLSVLASGKKIDLILSDIHMPKMDGIEFVKHVMEEGYGIPIVMISTEWKKEVIDKAISNGAVGNIRIPFTPEQLKEKLMSILAGFSVILSLNPRMETKTSVTHGLVKAADLLSPSGGINSNLSKFPPRFA